MTIPTNSPFDIKLSSGREARAYGLILDKGSGSLTIGAAAQDDSIYIRNVGKRVGDFDEQTNWEGGLGVERFSDNSEGFYSSNCWTKHKGHLASGLLWEFGSGFRKSTSTIGSTKSWVNFIPQIIGSSPSSGTIATRFTPDETGTYSQVQVWLRHGMTGAETLTMGIYGETLVGGRYIPSGAALATDSVAPSEFDGQSRLYTFSFTPVALTAGTYYQFTFTVDSDNSWEFSASTTGTNVYFIVGAGSYLDYTGAVQFRLLEAEVERQFFSFMLDRQLYVVDSKDDGTTASQLYINGDRGQATGGTTTTLVDTAFGCRSTAWPDNTFQGARIRYKVNSKWYSATITSHTGGTYTFAAQATAPAAGSYYYIYSTHVWMELTTTGLGVVTGEPAVFGRNVYFPQGDTVAMRCMATDFTVATNHKYRSEATAASMYATFLKVEKDALWRANNDTVTVSSSAEKTYGTDLSFGTAIKAGEISWPINGLNAKDGKLWIFKENGTGTVASGTYTKLESGEQQTPDPNNGLASVSIGKFIYYSWLHSVIRVFDTSHDNIGTSYSSNPDGSEGDIVSMDAYISDLLVAVDAGTTGTSSVKTYDGIGWHELFRGYDTGKRVRMVKTQPHTMRANMIWIQVGNDLAYFKMPYKKDSPLNTTNSAYQHECIFDSAAIDMGAASSLPKFIKSLSITATGLSTSSVSGGVLNITNNSEILLYYQTDEDCFTNTWIFVKTIGEQDSDVFLGLSNVRRFRYRLLLRTGSHSTPVNITCVVPNGYARTPLKQIFTMRIKSGGIYQASSQQAVSSSKLWRWLMDNARFPYAVKMESKYEEADGYSVIVHPPKLFPYKPPKPGIPSEAFMTLVLEEV